jgi:CO/xanthine dehydrogenase FAD-binding subunit
MRTAKTLQAVEVQSNQSGPIPRDRLEYKRANSIDEAVKLLSEPGVRTRVLSGGTDLMLLMREDRDLCDRVVDITLTPELKAIRQQGDVVTIGAAASFTEVTESPVVRESAPLLVAACHSVGAPQIRNMGTLGGNVANAAACADSLPALVCLDAIVHAQTPDGSLEWPASDFVVRPNRTKLPPGALLTSLSYRVPAAGSRQVFLKLGRRNALAISRLTVAALGRVDAQGKVVEIRLVPGSATPQIRRFPRAEAVLLGQAPTVALCEEAARVAVQEMTGITGKRWSSEFKEPALFSMVARALLQVFELGLTHDGGNGRAG